MRAFYATYITSCSLGLNWGESANDKRTAEQQRFIIMQNFWTNSWYANLLQVILCLCVHRFRCHWLPGRLVRRSNRRKRSKFTNFKSKSMSQVRIALKAYIQLQVAQAKWYILHMNLESSSSRSRNLVQRLAIRSWVNAKFVFNEKRRKTSIPSRPIKRQK